MTTIRRYTGGLACAALLASLGCGEARIARPAPPVPGMLSVVFTMPASDAGAVSFTLRGGRIGSVTAADASAIVFLRRIDETTVTVAVLGDRLGDVLVNFDVPDVGAVDSYAATIAQVASRDNTLLPSLQGYELAVRRGSARAAALDPTKGTVASELR